jgi:hypothetical protein
LRRETEETHEARVGPWKSKGGDPLLKMTVAGFRMPCARGTYLPLGQDSVGRRNRMGGKGREHIAASERDTETETQGVFGGLTAGGWREMDGCGAEF